VFFRQVTVFVKKVVEVGEIVNVGEERKPTS
jgi:hypothetical protein